MLKLRLGESVRLFGLLNFVFVFILIQYLRKAFTKQILSVNKKTDSKLSVFTV